MRLMVCGASGYVGSAAVALLHQQNISVIAPLRRSPAVPLAGAVVVDMTKPGQWPCWDHVASLWLCLGASGGRGYAQVDHDLTVAIAREAVARGVPQLQVISSVGAHPRSRLSYLRSKGAMEEELWQLPLSSLVIWQPGPLTGRQPPRWSERLLEPPLALLAALTGGRRSPWGAVTGQELAQAMLVLTQQPQARVRLGSGDIKALAAKAREIG